ERSLNGKDGWEELGKGGSAATAFTDTDVKPGETCYYCVYAYGKKVVASSTVVKATTPTAAPAPAAAPATGFCTSTADVGATGLAGSTRFDAASRTYTVSGAGMDIFAGTDAFQFAARAVTGDTTLVARLAAERATNP